MNNLCGETQRLSPLNLKLLAYLLKRSGQVVSRTELFDVVWPNQIVNDEVLTRAISDIRSQLSKLDANTRFIETLPKRGYRWCVDWKASEKKPIVDRDHQASSELLRSQSIGYGWIKHLGVMLCLAVLLASLCMWAVSTFLSDQAISIALLPTIAERPATEPLAQLIDEALLKSLRSNAQVRLLSMAAIKSRPQNPFPYFANEFGVTWVIESRISDLDGAIKIELSLVDAKTGVELRNSRFAAADRSDASQQVAQKLEFDLLVEPLPY